VDFVKTIYGKQWFVSISMGLGFIGILNIFCMPVLNLNDAFIIMNILCVAEQIQLIITFF
jgi:hypothetical protein